MTMRVPIDPKLLRWARERVGIAQNNLAAKFKQLPAWESGAMQPTLKQLEAFAHAVHVPIGYLFYNEPPQEPVPIPDFRTFDGLAVMRPSPDLLDTIYICQERQNWYRDFARVTAQPALDFVGSTALEAPPATIAAKMRQRLGFDLAAPRKWPTSTEALRQFIRQAGSAGVLVMVSGVVMSNNHRRLDPAEFRGFALSDPLAPLIFVNGQDTKAAQMFTLAHELAHLWLGESALSNIEAAPRSGLRREEMWCNAVAAELLVPLADLREQLSANESLPDALSRLVQVFKVSSLVMLLRLLDANWLSRTDFDNAWAQENQRQRERSQTDSSGSGHFYRTTLTRVSHRFARALVISTLEGQTLYRDALRMLGVSKTKTFKRLGREVGVVG